MHLIIIVGIVGRLSADCQHFDMHSNWDGNTLHKLKLSICPLGPLFLDFRWRQLKFHLINCNKKLKLTPGPNSHPRGGTVTDESFPFDDEDKDEDDEDDDYDDGKCRKEGETFPPLHS